MAYVLYVHCLLVFSFVNMSAFAMATCKVFFVCSLMLSEDPVAQRMRWRFCSISLTSELLPGSLGGLFVLISDCCLLIAELITFVFPESLARPGFLLLTTPNQSANRSYLSRPQAAVVLLFLIGFLPHGRRAFQLWQVPT